MAFALQNIIEVLKALQERGITNPFLQIGILATIAKESGFEPKQEYSYKNTSNQRLRDLFGTRLASYSDDQLTALKQDDIKFFDAIYGGRYGNDQPGDGNKYKGRGFNQVTFKDLYQKYGNLIGVDLVSKPERLNEVPIAAKVAAAYFSKSLESGKGKIASRYNVTDLSAINDSTLATQIAVNANAGWGKDTRGGFAEDAAMKFLDQVTAIHSNIYKSVIATIQKKKYWVIAGVIVILVIAGTLVYIYVIKKK